MKTKFLTTILTPKYKILNIYEYINRYNENFVSDYKCKLYIINNFYWNISINLIHIILNKRNI